MDGRGKGGQAAAVDKDNICGTSVVWEAEDGRHEADRIGGEGLRYPPRQLRRQLVQGFLSRAQEHLLH